MEKKTIVGGVVAAVVIVAILSLLGWVAYNNITARNQELLVAAEQKTKDVEDKLAGVEAKQKAKEEEAEAEAAKKVAEEEAKKKLAAAGMGGRKPPPDYASERALLDSGERAGERLAAMEAGDVRPLGRHPQDAAADRDRAIVLDNFIPDTSLVFGRVESKFSGAVRYDVNHQVQAPRFPHPDPRIPPPSPPGTGCPGCGGGSPPGVPVPAAPPGVPVPAAPPGK